MARYRNKTYAGRVYVCGANEVLETYTASRYGIEEVITWAKNKADKIWAERDRDQWGQTRIQGIRIDIGDCQAHDWEIEEKARR